MFFFFKKLINLYFTAVQNGQLVGIFSSSNGCGEIGDEIIFTKSKFLLKLSKLTYQKVYEYRDWIAGTMSIY